METNLTGDRIKSIVKSILFCIAFTGFLALSSFFKTLLPVKFERFAYGIIGTIVALLVTWVFLLFDKKTFGDIGLKWEPKTVTRFFKGLVIGLVIAAIMTLILLLFTNLKLKLSANYNIAQFLIWTLAFVPLAFMEVAFRAYPFLNLKSATGIRITQIIIAIMFALYHVVGGQSLFSSFLGPGVWAFVYGLAMIMSGGISLPTGLHFGTNLILAATGFHKSFEPIWTFQSQTVITPEMQQNIEAVGNTLQILLLLSTIGIMEWYIRKKTTANSEALRQREATNKSSS